MLRPGDGSGHRLAHVTGKDMGIYREAFDTTDDTHEWTTWEVYEQPAWRHAVVQIASAITLRTGRLEAKLEPLAQRLHDLRCDDDCWTGEVSRIKSEWLTEEGKAKRAAMTEWSTPMNHPEMWNTETTTMCNRTPLPATVDLWMYDFGNRDRRKIGTVEGPKTPLNRDSDAERGGKRPTISWGRFTQKRMGNR